MLVLVVMFICDYGNRYMIYPRSLGNLYYCLQRAIVKSRIKDYDIEYSYVLPMPKLILGAPDAITARFCCESLGADYIWASSFIISSMLGLRDEGMNHIDNFLPLLKGIILGATNPVILDFDIGGRDLVEFKDNIESLKSLQLGGVCIEDEGWLKKNAMLSGFKRTLSSSSQMCQKIKMVKSSMGLDSLVIARTHSLIAKEPVSELQERILNYQDAGADILCIHYTENDWEWYKKVIDNLNIKIPILLILSNFSFLPKTPSDFEYVLFPNQIYRMMIYSILNKMKKGNEEKVLNFTDHKMVETKDIFEIIENINHGIS